MLTRIATAILLALSILLSVNVAHAAEGTVPGWFKAGDDPSGYAIGTMETDGGHAAYIRALEPRVPGFGTLMQSFEPGQYLGKRIRLQAQVRVMDVEPGWVGMWLRADKDRKTVAFDNMKDRHLTGTADWQECSIVLDVPDDADNMAMGLILSGPGRAEWKDIRFEVVGEDVPVTDLMNRPLPKAPVNLDFQK